MKRKFNLFFATASLLASASAPAAAVYKANNTDNLNLLTSWSTTSGAQTPNPGTLTSTDVWYFNDLTMLASKTVSLGADMTIAGLDLDNTTANATVYNLVINSGNTLTLNGGTISGTGVSGGSGYSTAGIVLNRSGGGSVTLNCNVNIGAAQQWVTSRALTVGGDIALGANTLSFNTAGSAVATLSGVIGGTGGLNKTAGTGSLTLSGVNSSFSGAVTAAGGTMNVQKLATIGNNSSLGTGSGTSTITLNGANLTYTGAGGDTTDRSITMAAGAGILNNGTGSISFTAANVAQSGTASARTLTLGGSYSGATNTFASVIGNSGTGANLTSVTKSGASVWALTGASTFSGALAVNGGTIIFATAPNGTSSNLGNPGSISFGGSSSSTLQTAVGAGSVNLSTPTPITVASGAVFVAKNGDASGTTFETSAKITGAGGVKAQSPTTSGAILRFSNDTSDYTGTFSTGFGLVEFTSVANSGAASSLGAGSTAYAIGNSSSAIRLRYVGSGNTSTTRAIDWQATTGGLTLDNTGAGTVKYLATGNLVSGIGAKGLTLDGSNAGANELAQVVNDSTSGATSVTKSGTGTWTLSGVNTYTGTTTISGGTLGFSAASNQTLSGAISGTGGLAKSNGANLLLTGSNSYSGAITVSGGYVVFGSLTAEDGAPAVNLTGGNLALSGVFAGNTATIGNLSGNSSSSTINPNYDANTGFKTLSVNQTTDATFAGAIQAGTGSRNMALTKTGAAVLTLTGNNTYGGITNINAGALRVDGINSGTGAVNVGSSGTLGGSGSIAGAVNVSGVLAPGASIESLGTGALSFATGSTFAYELDSSSLNGDLADSTGTLDIAGGAILTLTELSAGTLLNASKLTLISYAGGWTSTELFTYLGGTLADDSTFTLGGNEWLFNYDDTTGGSNFTADQSGATSFVTMTVVPEPAAALLGGIGMLFLLRRRR